MSNVHMISNSHLDPVWQWELDEGLFEAISTFRTAAGFCEGSGGYIFNHNEAILYKWIEVLDAELFARIRKLVVEKKWHIMGGWYLQPDCNLPSGESFIRQILAGKNYFHEKFDVEPTTAINFDPFGHSRGLVQILKKTGYDSYLFCRPDPGSMKLDDTDFIWVGFDGSEVMARRADDFYGSEYGGARKKMEKFSARWGTERLSLVLWGVGNHGGGASRQDLDDLAKLQEENKDFNFIHSTPEAYFKELRESEAPLGKRFDDINSWAPGCYTSQIIIKQKHRQLENMLYSTEKMAVHAAANSLMEYPRKAFKEAEEDMLYAEFHDIIGGTCVQSVENNCIRSLDHGLEILSRVRIEALASLCAGQPKGGDKCVPIVIYNPHPHKVSGIFECEISFDGINWAKTYSLPEIFRDGKLVPYQAEKEKGNVLVDWRKRVSFYAELEPCAVNRFDCVPRVVEKKPDISLAPEKGLITFQTEQLYVVINCATGLIDAYHVNGFDYLKSGAFKPLVMKDNDDPWGSGVKGFTEVEGEFTLMTPEESAAFSGLHGVMPDAVRVIEDGIVRSIVEAVFKYGGSSICMQYRLPKFGTEVEVEVRVYWQEKSKMLKLALPTVFSDGKYKGQVAFGIQDLPVDGREAVSQKWSAVISGSAGKAFSCVNDCTYGSDFTDGTMRITLLKSSVYAALPVGQDPFTSNDRFIPRIDQGERIYRFRINGSDTGERMNSIDREAQVMNEAPYISPVYPGGGGTAPKQLMRCEDGGVTVSAVKMAEYGDDIIIRLYNPSEMSRIVRFDMPVFDMSFNEELSHFEVMTLKLNTETFELTEVNMIERKI